MAKEKLISPDVQKNLERNKQFKTNLGKAKTESERMKTRDDIIEEIVTEN